MPNRKTLKWIVAGAATIAILSACGGNSTDPGTEGSASHLLAESTVSTSTNLLNNPGFESGSDSWTVATGYFSNSSVIKNNAASAHSGSYYAEFAGSGLDTQSVQQKVTIPSGSGNAYLQFWYNFAGSSSGLDSMTVTVRPTSSLATKTLASFSSSWALLSGWLQSPKYDLSAYAGQQVEITFSGWVGLSGDTGFRIDDVVVTTETASSSTTTMPTTSDSNTFSGDRSNYTITKTSTGYVVTDKTGATAPRTLSNVSSIKFNDVTVNLGIGDKAQSISSSDLNSLIELYIAFFNRVPDADGLSYWIDQFKAGASLEDIAKSFYNAAVQYPTLTGYSTTMSNADFVGIVYKNVLGRSSVDADGLNYWTSALANGSQTRGSLVKTILASAHTFKGDTTYGTVADLLDNKIKVGTVYAVAQGITYNTTSDAVTKGIAIASATTATSTSSATSMYGVVDSGFSNAPTCVTNNNCVVSKYTLSPTSLDFGTVNVGECGSKTFAVQSTSGSVLATGVASTSGAFSIASGGNFSVSNGSSSTVTVKFCPTAAGSFAGNVSFATAASFSGASTVALSGTGATSSASSSPFAGTYSVSGGGVAVSFVVDSKGTVTSCSSGTLVVCSGSVSSSGSFTITGNDGQKPVDISATLTGTITSAGVVGGTYTGISVSSGSLSGSFSGSKSGGGTPGGTTTGDGNPGQMVRLTVVKTGYGLGTLSESKSYPYGTKVVVNYTLDYYSDFVGWTGKSDSCAGGTLPCEVTLTKDTYMEGRIEPAVFIGTIPDFSYTNTRMISSTKKCLWSVSEHFSKVEVKVSYSGAGPTLNLSAAGTRAYSSSTSGCESGSSTIGVNTIIDADGNHGFAKQITTYYGTGNEYMTLAGSFTSISMPSFMTVDVAYSCSTCSGTSHQLGSLIRLSKGGF